jgi:exosortase
MTTAPRTLTAPSIGGQGFLPALGALVVIWAVPIWHFSLEWNMNPQYHYGWVVPLLSLYLVRLRMVDCPKPSIPWTENRKRALQAMAVLIALYIPIIVVRVANPEWRPFGYFIAFQAIALTWMGLYLSAGWRVAWHFAFPIAFFLVAAPWPRPVDAPLMDFLMQKNAGAAIEGLLWQGIAASRKGNLVLLPTGTVGVDEACSGIRSLQGTMMLALFLGEMYRLGFLRRSTLLVSGVGVALMTNAIRTYMLARVAAEKGVDAVESWHDSAGYTILTINFVLLWLAAIFLARLPSTRRVWLQNWWNKLSFYSGESTQKWLPPSPLWLVVLLATVGGGFVFSSWWYARGESMAEAPVSWRVEEPASATGFQRQRIPDNVLITLRHDSGWTARWEAPDKAEIQAWYLRWLPGRNAAQLANLHDPRVCLSGLGLEMQAELGTWELDLGKLILPVQTFRFRDGPQVVHVFYALLDDLAASQMSRQLDNSILSRLRAAKEGVRHRGQRLVEIGIWGDFPEAKAREMVRQFLSTHTVVDGPA